jgi:protein gp37
MGDKTNIEYLDATWNPIKGCSHASSGCDYCWAERQANRFSKKGEFFHGLTKHGAWTGKTKFYKKELLKPIHWKRPRRIGVCFMGDLFHESVPFEWIAKVFAVMAKARQHTFMILTKRPERMAAFLACAGGRVCPSEALYDHIEDDVKIDYEKDIVPWPLQNVWLGTSIENQLQAKTRIPALFRCDAVFHYVSVEPMLGRIDLTHLDVEGAGDPEWCQIDALTGRQTDMGRPCPSIDVRLDFVIVGGESGPDARSTHPMWVYDLQGQCDKAWVPFFFKQWGEWMPVEDGSFRPGDLVHYTEVDSNPRRMRRVGKRAAGNLIMGKAYQELPAGATVMPKEKK